MYLFDILPSFFIIIYFALIGVSIYCFILFIKLANRGIEALDIYIDKSKKE